MRWTRSISSCRRIYTFFCLWKGRICVPTPYGINTHRLLVRGHRVPNEWMNDPSRVTADGVQIEPVIVAPAIGVPLLVGFLAVQTAGDRRRKAWSWLDGEDD